MSFDHLFDAEDQYANYFVKVEVLEENRVQMISGKPMAESTGRKILIVDDNTELAEMIAQFLTNQGFQISIAQNGSKAIDHVLIESPELVLLDLHLPDMTGVEVLKKISKIDENIFVIVITAYGGEEIAVDLMKAGATDFLSKPFGMKALSDAVKNAVKLRDAKIEDGLKKSYPSLERFFPFFAHEIRNPLHAIGGALAIITKRSDVKDEVLRQSIKIIENEIQHLDNFVEECLNFVRPPLKAYWNDIEIREIISGVTNLLPLIYSESFGKFNIITDLDPQLPRVRVNYEEIKQAFLNISKNSLDAMTEGGKLIIRACHRSDPFPNCVEVTFRDSGSGVKKEHMKHLFSPFFTTKQRGTGLGLAISRKIIEERHHGRISIESEESKGTTVRVELPVAQPMELSAEKI